MKILVSGEPGQYKLIESTEPYAVEIPADKQIWCEGICAEYEAVQHYLSHVNEAIAERHNQELAKNTEAWLKLQEELRKQEEEAIRISP